MVRRNFLKAIGAALATGISVFSTRSAFSKSGGMEEHGHTTTSNPENHDHGAIGKYPPLPGPIPASPSRLLRP